MVLNGFVLEEIESIEECGEQECYDIAILEEDVLDGEPNYLAEGFLVHNSGMATNYCQRKKGIERYDVHPLMEPILGHTYGVLVYQEQVMKLLHVVGGIPLKDCEIVRKAISKKKVDKFIKYKVQFLTVGQERLGWTLEQVSELWDHIEAFAGYGFNLSHAVAYTYVSSRLLALKAHYPLEFFTAILSCESMEDKVKEYKVDAEKFGLTVNRLDLNKSGATFQIVDDEIYIGFSNVKGIGREVAERIVEHQPYTGLEDFLEKFGTDANVLKPLIGLRIFDGHPLVLYEFVEHYKEVIKKRQARDKRNADTRKRYVEEFMYLIPDGEEGKYDYEMNRKFMDDLVKGAYDKQADFNKAFIGCEGEEQIPGLDTKEAFKIYKKYRRAVEGHQKKLEADESVKLEDFRPKGKLDAKIRDLLGGDPLKAEGQFYGFNWDSLLVDSPDFIGDHTFADFEKRYDLNDTVSWLVEVQVVSKPQEKTSKGSGKKYYVMEVQDADGVKNGVTIWGPEYGRFKDELNFWESESRMGNLLQIRLTRPNPPFKNYTFESDRTKKYPEDKSEDVRLTVMRRPPAPVEEEAYPEPIDDEKLSEVIEI